MKSGRPEIYVAKFSPDGRVEGLARRVSVDGGRAPRWDRSGTRLFFRSLDDHVIHVSVTLEGDALLAESPVQGVQRANGGRERSSEL